MSELVKGAPELPGIAIVGHLGRGGAAEVFEAVRTDADGTQRRVAVKRLAVERDLPPKAQERFVREARIAGELSHPNIVRVLELLWRGAQPYLILERLRGCSMLELERGASVPAEVALAVALQVLDALVYLHAWRDRDGAGGLVHRDVTPGNLFLCDDGRVKLLDFGVAKQSAREELALTQALTRQGAVVGTVPFLSPEQARSAPLDGRSDLFQLAGSLYYLLSGVGPWGRGAPTELLDRAMHEAVPPLAGLRPDLDPALVELLTRALAPEREARFSDAKAMLSAAEQVATRFPTANAAGLAAWLAERGSASQEAPEREAPRPAAEVQVATGEEPGGAARPPVDAAPARAGQRLGRYLLLERIGQGGMGVVHSGYDPDLDRKVALKLLHVRAGKDQTAREVQVKLLQEAQALARVSHPNVVSLFDVGTFEDRVFLAMELVEGGTLRSWLRAAPRSWRQVLPLYRQAGAGLAAAHRAGLVHRDFKPDNVLLGKDGRARVTDFGLARRANDLEGRDLPAAGGDAQASESATFGTPAYMSPEQHQGQAADARSDQFSFCAALYEALYHELPFDPVQLAAASPEARDALLPPFKGAQGAEVPAWIGRVLRRGLSLRPEARYPSIDALLEELGKDPAVRRRRLLGVLALVGLTALTAVGVHHLGERQVRLCQGSGRLLEGVWDEPTKARIRQAFLAVGERYAAETWNLTARTLDHYVEAWSAMRTDACLATRVRGEQSDAVLTLRMICLDDAHREIAALSQRLANADADIVRNAAQAALRLPPLSDCADVPALESGVKLPDDPVLRAKVLALKGPLAKLGAAQHLGKFEESYELAQVVVKEARAIGYRPFEAKALYIIGWHQIQAGAVAAGEASLKDSLLAAIASNDDVDAAGALNYLYFVVGYMENKQEEADWIGENAKAMLERMRGSLTRKPWLLNSQGAIEANRGEMVAAAKHIKEAISVASQVPGFNEWEMALLRSNLGEVLQPLGRYEEAASNLKTSLALSERILGREHPLLALAVTNMATLLVAQERYAEALPYAQRSLALRQGSSDNMATTQSLVALASCQLGLKHYALAAQHLARARALFVQSKNTHHPDYATVLYWLAELHRVTGRYQQALEEGLNAVAVLEKAQGEKGSGLLPLFTGLGQTYLALGRGRLAISVLRRAVSLADHNTSPATIADSYFALAQALWTDRAQRRAAHAAAERARQEALRARIPPRISKIETWLETHR